MGSDCAAGRGATPSEVVWVLAPVISIICAMAFFGARRFGLIGGRPAAADRRPEAFAADLVVSHPLKVIALNVWLIIALSIAAFVDVGCGELRESIDVLLDVDACVEIKILPRLRPPRHRHDIDGGRVQE